MRLDKGFLIAIVGLLLWLSMILVLPYIQFVLGAVVLAFVLRPVQVRLQSRIGETMAAAVLVLLSFVAIVLPFFAVAAFVAGDAIRFVRSIEERELEFSSIEQWIAERTGREVDIAGTLQSSVGGANESLFGGAVTLFETLTHLLIGIGLLLFLLLFLIRDGDRFVRWLRQVTPMPPMVIDDLLASTRDITRAVLAGHVLVAIIQGVIAGLGLLAVGIPNAVFWTFVMIVLALIPIIGTFVVWAPASAYLFANGNTVAAVALFVYGTIVVGISDEYLRPVIVDRYAKVSPSVIIIGVIGGISAFGFMGLFVGPIIVGILKVTIEVYDEHYGRWDESPMD